MTDAFRLEGRTAVVTGARSGIGRAIARGYADAGAHVIVWGRTDDVEQVAEEITDDGGSAEAVVADLMDLDGAYAVAQNLASTRTIDVLVNSAGIVVNVNALAPGYVDTANTAELRADPQRAAEITARIPAGRWATPDDLVGPAIFLASGAADYVHGQVLAVDGGWLAI